MSMKMSRLQLCTCTWLKSEVDVEDNDGSNMHSTKFRSYVEEKRYCRCALWKCAHVHTLVKVYYVSLFKHQ